MHLSAAVPFERGRPRATVIVAGAREPEAWERYPAHIFHARNDSFECACCWHGDHFSSPVHRAGKRGSCENIRNTLPACMDAISVEDVISSIEKLLTEGRSRALNAEQLPFA